MPYPPALKYADNWTEAVQNICNDWVQDQTSRTTAAESPQAAREISYMLALAHEFKHLKTLRKQSADELILGDIENPKQAYAEEMIRALLRAAGETDVDAVLNSFKHTGTGASHRQLSTVVATVANFLGAAQLLVPEPTAKAAISATRLAAQVGLSAAVVDSGHRRLFNSGTEDALPLGRADAAAAARLAPNVLQASWSVLRELKDVEKDMLQLHEALENLKQANVHPAEDAVKAAHDNLNLVFARICHKLTVKQRYKAASENAKVEWRGNERSIYCGTTGTALTLTAAGIGILTPEILAAAISGGLLAGAATTSLLLYLGYQLSTGPAKDGEAKARRAIISLAKLTEALDPAQGKAIQERAAAYERYRKECDTPSLLQPARKKAAREAARQRLFAALRGIAATERENENDHHSDKPFKGVMPDENWEQYRNYQRARTALHEPGPEPSNQQRVALNALDDEYYQNHAIRLTTKPLVEGWKRQIRIKMDAAQRLLTGKVARAQKHVLKMQSAAPSRKQSENLDHARAELRQALRNMVQFELAYSQMKVGDDGSTPDEAALARAKAAFGMIGDSDVRMLFCGDAEQQVKATHLSKRLTVGETERYTLLNTGANALAMGLGVALQAGDLGIAVDKVDGEYRGPKFNDFKLVATLNGMPTPSGPLSTGDRTPFQVREMSPLLQTILPGLPARDPSAGTIGYEPHRQANEAESVPMQSLDSQIDALIDLMSSRNSVFETLTLELQDPLDGKSAAVPASDGGGDGGGGSGSGGASTIRIDLTKTAAFHRVRYKNASPSQKARYIAKEAAIAARQTGSIYLGPLAQLAAKPRLDATRVPLNEARDQVAAVRKALLNEAPVTQMQSGAPVLPEFGWLSSPGPDSRNADDAVPDPQRAGSPAMPALPRPPSRSVAKDQAADGSTSDATEFAKDLEAALQAVFMPRR